MRKMAMEKLGETQKRAVEEGDRKTISRKREGVAMKQSHFCGRKRKARRH